MENKKYELTNESKIECGVKLFRIKTLMSFGCVLKGELGGWIEKEGNLSVYGDAWVYDDASVYGDACVSGNARVYGNACVYGDARVYGDAWVSGNACVYGNARVSLKKAYTKGDFVYSSDSTFNTTIIDQSKEIDFNNNNDYKNLLVVGDYEINNIDEPTKEIEMTMEEINKKLGYEAKVVE